MSVVDVDTVRVNYFGKFWVHETSGGERREVYTVLADSETPSREPTPASCCSAKSDSESDPQPAAASRGSCGRIEGMP